MASWSYASENNSTPTHLDNANMTMQCKCVENVCIYPQPIDELVEFETRFRHHFATHDSGEYPHRCDVLLGKELNNDTSVKVPSEIDKLTREICAILREGGLKHRSACEVKEILDIEQDLSRLISRSKGVLNSTMNQLIKTNARKHNELRRFVWLSYFMAMIMLSSDRCTLARQHIDDALEMCKKYKTQCWFGKLSEEHLRVMGAHASFHMLDYRGVDGYIGKALDEWSIAETRFAMRYILAISKYRLGEIQLACDALKENFGPLRFRGPFAHLTYVSLDGVFQQTRKMLKCESKP
jgi:hypothetical protein